VSVIEGDGRKLDAMGVAENSIDIVITSPPYPNNIDYSEVYKLELWLLGFITSAEEFLRLRKATLRSHPTSDLAQAPDVEFLAAIATRPLCQYFGAMLERTESFNEGWRTKLALGYFSDIWVSLRQQLRCLRKGGHAFLVVANSLHGSAGKAYLVPTDLLVGQIGRALGFELERIMIARNTRRRLSGNHFLRESIVILRKCDAE
jgi:DNA modification methylase